jgi:hypothetical protein
MALLKLRKANENGDEVGSVFLNTDQIVTINAGQGATEIRTTDGHSSWVKETPEEVVTKAKAAS